MNNMCINVHFPKQSSLSSYTYNSYILLNNLNVMNISLNGIKSHVNLDIICVF